MGENKIFQILLPILLTALLATIGFLVSQVISLKGEIADLRVCEMDHFGELSKDMALHGLTIQNLSSKIDRIETVRVREEGHER